MRGPRVVAICAGHVTMIDEQLDPFRAAVPHIVVTDGAVTEVSPAVSGELGCDAALLVAPLDRIGTRLDDVTFDEVCNGTKELRIRLGAELDDRPIRLRRLHGTDEQVWLNCVRSPTTSGWSRC